MIPLFLLGNWRWLAPSAVALALGIMLGVSRFQLAHRSLELAQLHAAVAELRASGQQLVAESEAKARAIESRYAALNIQIEKDHADAQATLDQAHADAQRLVARIGLFDKAAKPRDCGGDSLPGAAGAPGGGPSATTGVRLSETASQFLLQLTADADRAAEYGRACHAWAMSIGR